MSFVGVHGYVVGFAIPAAWLIICLWALFLRLRKAEEAPLFWRVVSVAQVLLALQFFLGLALLTLYSLGRGGLPGSGSTFDVTFHLLYGAGFPLAVLVVAHRGARDGRFDAYAAFAVVGLVIFGLTARAWMVGAGL